jgi:hypothetical protein
MRLKEACHSGGKKAINPGGLGAEPPSQESSPSELILDTEADQPLVGWLWTKHGVVIHLATVNATINPANGR